MTDIVPAEALTERRFVNQHLSVSRLKRFEQCPRAFELHYVRKSPGVVESGGPAAFGSLLHAALERLFLWVVEEEFSGTLPEDKLLEFYRDEWARSQMSGGALYQEGLTLLRGYLRLYPEVDHFAILGVEVEFNLQVEEFTINGYIDRVDRIDDETIAIIDYKSNRLMFSQEEVDHDLQMSVYALAARALWPWAKKVRFIFHMLRHDAPIETTRSAEQVDEARDYVLATGRQTELATTFAPRINTNCGYCDHRRECTGPGSYAEAIARVDERVLQTPEALDDLSRLREHVAALAKILDQRKRELDNVIRAQLEHVDVITLGEVVYKLVPWTQKTLYPFDRTLQLLDSKLTTEEGLPAFDTAAILRSVCTIDPKALEAFLADEAPKRVPKAQLLLVRAEIDQAATRIAGSPRLHATPMKSRKKKPDAPALEAPPLVIDPASLAPGEPTQIVTEEGGIPIEIVSTGPERIETDSATIAKIDEAREKKSGRGSWTCTHPGCGHKTAGRGVKKHREEHPDHFAE